MEIFSYILYCVEPNEDNWKKYLKKSIRKDVIFVPFLNFLFVVVVFVEF